MCVVSKCPSVRRAFIYKTVSTCAFRFNQYTRCKTLDCIIIILCALTFIILRAASVAAVITATIIRVVSVYAAAAIAATEAEEYDR